MPQSVAGWEAVGALYHAWITGLILTTVTRRSAADAAELVFHTFRRLSNDVGGVRVEYMYASDRKAWVRYVPPRWIYDGATICAVPSEITRAIDCDPAQAPRSWRLMAGTDGASPAIFDAWNELWVGARSIHDRRARLGVDRRPGERGTTIVWRIAR